MQILIATRRAEELAPFADALAAGVGAELRFTDDWPNTLAVARDMPPAFAVLDEGLAGGGPLELAREIMRANAMINVAVVSAFDAKAFHEAAEGLGILAPVPARPTAADGETLAAIFRRFLPEG
jgi:ActR/RegA family two-component response regulator